MPVAERIIVCPKCGREMELTIIRRLNTYACISCKEPIAALRKADRVDWSQYFPKDSP